MKDKVIKIESIELYRMMLANLRYAYTRNNHLQPSSTYDYFKERLIPTFLEADQETALHTMQQMCEECISDEICTRFYDGEEDENGNRRASIEFVEYLLGEIHKHEPNWYPYSYDQFINNKNLDNEPVYLIYEVKNNRKYLVSDIKYSVVDVISKLLKDILHLSEEELNRGIYYNRERIKNSFFNKRSDKYCKRFDDFVYTIKEPINRKFYIKNTKNDRFKKVRGIK